MSSGQLEKVVHHLRRMAGISDAQRAADGQLLERYISSRDENAFAVLVRRYGRLVRSVCRNILRHEQDIEDAFQVTFMVFACKAASIRKSSSVASWLYGVAYRTAMNTKRTRTRRCEKQREPEGHSREQPVAEASLREIQAILDEEVQRLPEKYRSPFILCCLEGKSRAEAGEQLGLMEGTVSSRLAQARKRLQQRLTRRGVVLSAVLCAVELSRTAAASVAPILVKGTIQAALSFAAGNAAATHLISAEVASLASSVLQALFAKTVKMTTIALLTIGLMAGAGLLACHVLAQKPAAEKPQNSPPKAKETPAAPKRDSIEVTTICGRVLDPDGKPMTGAELYLAKPTVRWYTPKLAPSLQVKSGPDGRFRFAVPKSDLDFNAQEELPAQVMAIADGFGCDWATIEDVEPKEITLRLVKDVPLAMRILDLNGRPVAGVKLIVTDLWYPKGDGLGSFLDAIRKNGEYAIDKDWDRPLPGPLATATTGRDGRFRLAGIGRERLVNLRLDGPAIATASLCAMTRKGDTVANPKKGRANDGVFEIYGAASEYVAAVSRPIRGVVRDKETGKPLAGVAVGGGYDYWVKTDEKGRYELLGFFKASRYLLQAEPADGRHFQRHVVLQDTPGLDALTCDIALVQGLMVRGRVTDKETSKAVAGAQIQYWPLGGNSYVNKLLPASWGPHSKAIAGPDGSYALTVMPGPGAITVTAPKRYKYMPAAVSLKERKEFFKTPLLYDTSEDGLTTAQGDRTFGGISPSRCNAVILLEPAEKEKSLVRDVALQKPLERKGQIVDADGQPIRGVRLYSPHPQYWAENLKGAEFTVRSINPRSPRALVFYHKEKNLGYYVKDLRREPAGPLTIQLQPCGSASGRILDAEGKPAAGLRGHLHRVDHKGAARSIDGEAEGGYQRVITDKDGRFRVEGLVSGQEYRVTNYSDRRPGFGNLYVPLIVKPGEHKDMGDLKMNRIE